MALTPTVRTPSSSELMEIGADLGFNLDDEAVESFRDFIAGALTSYTRADELVEPKLPVRYPRDAGFRPEPADNPLNAWYWRCEIKGATEGLLRGKTIALKDNVCLSGIPLMNGSRLLEGYVPDQDATIVTRILEAGGTILGKAACENLCLSGGSHTSALGMIRNPHKPTHSAGGSSGGSAALVAAGDVDLAIGGDQGGSIRLPASWCGVYGLKPTFGLVPYTGIFPIENTLDHTGPMAANTEDLARLLTVIAGPDGLDPRQTGAVPQDYLGALGGDLGGLTIGILQEGFGLPESTEEVDRGVRSAARRLGEAGAKVEEISVPMHLDGRHLWTLIGVQGFYQQMIKGNGFGLNAKGHYVTGLADHFGQAWRTRPDDFPDTVKVFALLAEFLDRNQLTHYYAKGQNLGRSLAAAYDAALERCDLLLLPTTPMQATELPAPDCTREEFLGRAFEMVGNTMPFNITGHPALNVPCGTDDQGLPLGMMLVGRSFEEVTLLRAANAFEALAS